MSKRKTASPTNGWPIRPGTCQLNRRAVVKDTLYAVWRSSATAGPERWRATTRTILSDESGGDIRVRQRLEIAAGLYNLFDVDYAYPGSGEHVQDQIEQDGRTFRIKLTYRF